MSAYGLIVGLCWLALAAVWVVMAFSAKRTARRSWDSMWVRLVIAAIVLLLFMAPGRYFAHLAVLQMGPVAGPLGVVLCAAGVTFAIWARLYLGHNWGMPMTLRKDHELVTTGPYAWVRHPIYSGVMLAMLGTALVSPWWILILVVFSTYYIYSAHQEEKLMLKEFPNAYPTYMRHTKRLIPWVY